MKLCRIQVAEGLYFLHEHPAGASSWKEECVKEILELPNVERVVGNTCAFGVLQEDSQGVGMIKKPTGFMTNACKIAEELNKECERKHTHVHLMNGRAKRAEVYPDELCFSILKGLVKQMYHDGRLQAGQIGAVMAEDESQAFDDTTGEELVIDTVLLARIE